MTMKIKLIIVLAATGAVLLLTPVVLGQAGFDLSWWTVDGGGATFSSGGSYELGGTIGQPDAGTLSGGDYTLGGGFWVGGAAVAPTTPTATPTGTVAPPTHLIYLPIVLKNWSPH